MREYRIKQQNMIVSVFLGGSKGNIIYASGLPQYLDKNHPLVQQSVKLGYNLFIPKYPGSYESSGFLTIDGCVKALENTQKIVRRGYAKELFSEQKITWDPTKIFILGFSFGGLPALLSKNSNVDKKALVCPFISLSFHDNNTNGESLSSTLDFIKRAYPHVYRFDKDRLLKSIKDVTLPARSENLIIVEAIDDQSISKEEIDFLTTKYHCQVFKKSGSHSINMPDELFKSLWSSHE